MSQERTAWFVIILRGDQEHPQVHYGDKPNPKRTDAPKRRFLGNPIQISPEHTQDQDINLTRLNEIYRPKVLGTLPEEVS